MLDAELLAKLEDEEDLTSEADDENHLVTNVTDKTEEDEEIENNDNSIIVNTIIQEIIENSFLEIDKNLPKTVTSLYGKVYVLKPSIKSL